MIPGPSEPEPEVLAELSLPIIPHYGMKWLAFYTETRELMQQVFRTKNEVMILPIPGQLAVEMAALNTVKPGDEAIVCVNGVFSEAILDAVRVARGTPIEVRSEPGLGATMEQVKAAVERMKDPSGKTIFLVQNETSTGAAVGPAEIFRYCKSKGMFTVLDAISAIGGIDLRTDEWQIDYVIGYASKALGGVNGVVPVAVSKEVWADVAKRKGQIHSTFLDLNAWREAVDLDTAWGHPHPTSMPSSVIVALHKAILMALAEGLDNRYARHAAAAKEVRDGLNRLGLEVLTDPRFYSNTVSVGKIDPRLDAELRKRLVSDYDIMIAGGLGALRGKAIRIGHMGTSARPERVHTTLAAIEQILKKIR